jgi:hypothetical protein
MAQSPPRITSGNFRDHLKRQRSDPLFHYTDQHGLLGILGSGAIHATKVQYMNDAKEFQLAIDLLQEFLRTQPEPEAEPQKQKFSDLKKIGFGIAHINLFVACFCGTQDLLSQWRGYGAKASRYSIGFHPSHLYASAFNAGFHLGAAIYDRAQQWAIVAEIVDLCLKDDECTAADAERAICEVGAFFKHETFREEQEWRLVSPILEISHPSVGFRPGKSMVTPYASFPLDFTSPGLVSEICVGPCPHEKLAQSAITMLLMKHDISLTADYRVPPVYNSKIPFRDW